MLRFHFQLTESSFRLPDPSDPIYQLEEQVDQSHNLPPLKRLALLYNDAKNYIMGEIQPFEAWYQKRIRILREYAALDWLALGEHLGRQEPGFKPRCQAIHDGLHQLLQSTPSQSQLTPVLDLPLFCRTLAAIDSLWHIVFPRHLTQIEDPAVEALLVHCGIQAKA